jgi:hypothetical protein
MKKLLQPSYFLSVFLVISLSAPSKTYASRRVKEFCRIALAETVNFLTLGMFPVSPVKKTPYRIENGAIWVYRPDRFTPLNQEIKNPELRKILESNLPAIKYWQFFEKLPNEFNWTHCQNGSEVIISGNGKIDIVQAPGSYVENIQVKTGRGKSEGKVSTRIQYLIPEGSTEDDAYKQILNLINQATSGITMQINDKSVEVNVFKTPSVTHVSSKTYGTVEVDFVGSDSEIGGRFLLFSLGIAKFLE